MIGYTVDDIMRLSHEVRRFVIQGDNAARLELPVKIVLTFKNVADMTRMCEQLMLAVADDCPLGRKPYIHDAQGGVRSHLVRLCRLSPHPR